MSVKGTSISIIRRLVKEKGKKFEQNLLKQLSSEALHYFETASPTNWIPPSVAVEITLKTAPLFFPNNPTAARDLYRVVGRESISTFYRFILRIPSPFYFLKHVSDIWEMYWQKGQAHIEKNDSCYDLVITGYPELDPEYTVLLGGYVLGVMDGTSAKNVQIEEDISDPENWRLHVHWDNMFT